METKARLLAAASELFAQRGFHGTTVRDIAQRAGVNLAAGHYHFGSKKELYLEVLRAQSTEIRALLERRGATRPASELGRLSAAALAELLRTRTHAMLDIILGSGASVHATLMQREMTDPSEALPIIVEEFIAPLVRETAEIVAHLAPHLDPPAVQRCVFSILGQSLFYRFTRPATLRMLGRRAYTQNLASSLADHVTEFSLGGLQRVAARARRGRHGR